ncbi:MAG: ribulose-phosphate 3-epimerase [Defluviitaleaceae bacterium]|nr:ribulose-phosphate 3-epimerase [Defluviitaleaceae bacterium]
MFESKITEIPQAKNREKKQKKIRLSPSILSADFGRLADQLLLLKKSGIEYVHIDVMDGLFVPNLTIGMPVVKCIRKHSDLIFDTHLMIDRPEMYAEEFIKSGSDIISFHPNVCDDCNKLIRRVKACKKKIAMALNPDEDFETILNFIGELDMVLVMSVYPGFGGQTLIVDTLKKAEKLRNFAINHNLSFDIQMDGGINLENLRDVLDSGVDIVVAGSAIFDTSDIPETLSKFHEILSEY